MQSTESEQGAVSAQATEPKDEKQSNTELLEECRVEINKVFTVLDELVERKLSPPEQATPQEQPAEETTEEKGPGATIEDMVEHWLRNQDYSTKLAIYIFDTYRVGDHNTDFIDGLETEYKQEIARMAENPESSLTDEERFYTGLAAELVVWEKNL